MEIAAYLNKHVSSPFFTLLLWIFNLINSVKYAKSYNILWSALSEKVNA
jgi:hypothetical protein